MARNVNPSLSSDPRDKLLAARNHDRSDLDHGYVESCAHWFASLTPAERAAASAARAALNRRDEPLAEEFARTLPPAPRCPL
jgi:hypothetical protein